MILCETPTNPGTPPLAVKSGTKVHLYDQYGNPVTLVDEPGSILVVDNGGKVRWADGSVQKTIPGDKIQSGMFLKTVLGVNTDGDIAQVIPAPGNTGIQILEYEDGEWRMNPRGQNASCFPAEEIVSIPSANLEGLAAFEECGGGTVCLRMLNPCAAAKLLPAAPGVMVEWPGCADSVPSGYTIADGKSLTAATYPDLFAAYGYTWGGEGDVFRVPDMRGRYPRGVNSGSVSPRMSINGSNASGIGSYQEGRMQEHGHAAGATITYRNATGGITVIHGPAAVGGDLRVAQVYWSFPTSTHTASVGGVTGATPTFPDETTVPNAAVFFIISTGCAVD